MIWLGVLLFVVIICAAPFLYLAWFQRWQSRHTRGMAYYGKSLAQRRAFKKQVRLYSRPILPLVRLLALGNRERAAMPVFEYEGVWGPPGVSSPKVFESAKNYRPRPEDVFVATQMRCGTTWMQQIVYEIVNRGHGDLSDKGHGHLYAVSPWIDGINSVSMERAPLVGEKSTRIIKTHLPTRLCPYGKQAKYIYVARHPVNCFASILDYNRTLLGPLAPEPDKIAEWFCSDRMYWSPWPKHTDGWWRWSREQSNVLFVHYEELAAEFYAVLDRIADFLGYRLTENEKERIRDKSSFQYMKKNEEFFEMAPPNMFSVISGEFLPSGKARRDQDVTPVIRQRILDYCRQFLREGDYPAASFYPDLASSDTNDIIARGKSAGEASQGEAFSFRD